MVKNLVSRPILAPLDQIPRPSQIFFVDFTSDIVGSYHCMQFQGKIMNQTWENSKKPSFGPEFGPNLGHRFFFFFFKSGSLSH